MIVSLIGRNIIFKQKLPISTVGNYWINNNDGKKLLNIEGNNENWYISSNNYVKILKKEIDSSENISKIVQNKNNIIQKLKLNIYEVNYIYLEEYPNNIFAIYCTPTYENNYTQLEILNSQAILIGNGRKNHISYENETVKEHHARIFFSNGRLMLENYDNVFGTFVNNIPVLSKKKLLFNGDVIFIMGLKIIILGRSIFINNPQNKVSFNNQVLRIKEKDTEIEIPKEEEKDEEDENLELYAEKDYFARAPRITNIIEKETIKIDPPPQSQNKEGTPMLYVIGTSLTMGLMSIITMISTITGVVNRNDNIKRFNIFYNYISSYAYKYATDTNIK